MLTSTFRFLFYKNYNYRLHVIKIAKNRMFINSYIDIYNFFQNAYLLHF